MPVSSRFFLGLLSLLLVLVAVDLPGQQKKPPGEDDYYPLLTLPIPDGVVLEASALEMMGNGKLAVASRRGDIYLVEVFGTFDDDREGGLVGEGTDARETIYCACCALPGIIRFARFPFVFEQLQGVVGMILVGV